jgi:hypothetical protein
MDRRPHRGAIARTFVIFLASATTLFGQYSPAPDLAGGWHTLTNPKEVAQKTGLDVEALDQAFAYIQGSSQHGGLLVVSHGWLVYERYFGPASREATPDSGSCGKAFASVAMGILMNERPDLFRLAVWCKMQNPARETFSCYGLPR